MADITIPEIPAALTADQAAVLQLQFHRISLMQAEEARKLAVQHEANAAARHAALLAQHKANNGPLTFGDLAAAAAARADLEVSVEQLDRVTRKRWEWLQDINDAPTPSPEPAPPAAPSWRLPKLTTEAEFAKLRGFGGFNAAQGAPAADYLPSLRATGATQARCWYLAKWDGQAYVVDQAQRDVMQAAVRQADELGLYLVICVQINSGDMPWASGQMLVAYVELMADLAREHQGQTPIAAWDLTNEPSLHRLPDGREPVQADYHLIVTAWRALAHSCIDAMRAAADPWRLMVYQMGIGGDPSQFEDGLPLDRGGVIHSAHVYHPHTYTHQQVAELASGQAATKPWLAMTEEDRATLAASLARLGRWSDRHGRTIYVGEFAAVRFAPDAPLYLRLVTDFGNARGWPWSKHDWRGWWGWDSELVGPQDAAQRQPDTNEMQVLLAALKMPPPGELDPVFYLAELGDEFDRYKWPRTLQGAIDHWKQYGKPQGRRGRAGGPGWGPKAKDAPPGTVL